MSRLAALLAIVMAMPACGSEQTPDNGEPAVSGPLSVLAASSLTEVFAALEPAFEAEHPRIEVRLQHGASTALARQVGEGAPADVLATADRASIDSVGSHVDAPTVFARNRLAIVVERGNPLAFRSLADLSRPGVKAVVCAVEVPCGRLADAAMRRAGVTLTPVSREQNVKAVLSKVLLGEADAGIVYATDVRAARGRADGVSIDDAGDPQLQAEHLVAVVTASERGAAARLWIRFLMSPTGRRVLRDAGFELP